jgi:hypothetical protein
MYGSCTREAPEKRWISDATDKQDNYRKREMSRELISDTAIGLVITLLMLWNMQSYKQKT